MATPSIAPKPNTSPTTVNGESPTTTVKGGPNDSLSSPVTEPDAAAAEKIAKSVNNLNSYAIAIQAFKARYDELQNHLDFIGQAIDARSKELDALPSQGGDTSNGVIPSEPKAETLEVSEDDVLLLCQKMCSRELRRYIITNLSDPNLLREKVPAAIQGAPMPAKIVFECIGRFYLQGSKAYAKGKDSNLVRTRQASLLALECYLLSGCVGSENDGMEASLKEEADKAAVAWRKRLIVEGGVAKASESDARGLILFIACFGIPGVFRNEDVCNLVKLSNAREISHALRQSQWLLKRVSEIADGMMKKGMVLGSVVEAVDLAYTFGFEEKFSPQTTLTSFLQKSEEAWKITKQESRAYPNVLRANEKYLAALKSVVNCLEGHKIDLIKFLPGWELKDKIINLEKDLSDVREKMEVVAKRKVDKTNSSNKVKIPEAKRPRFPAKDPAMASHSVAALQEQRIARHMDGNSSYDASLTAHLLDGRPYGYSNNYPSASSLQIGSVSRSLPESYLGGAIASGVGGAIAGSAMSAGIGAPNGSYSGYQGDIMIDPYRRHGTGDGGSSYDWAVGQSYAGQPLSADRVNDLYGRTSVDGFAGIPDHPSIGIAGRSGGGPDLYSFADSVFD